MHYEAMSMMVSQILKFVNFTKNSKIVIYLENKISFFLQIKKSLHIKGYFMAKKSFVVKVTFKRK